jgi:hypothetical protein
MAKQKEIFSKWSNLVIQHAEAIEEALSEFRKEWNELHKVIFNELRDELRKEKIFPYLGDDEGILEGKETWIGMTVKGKYLWVSFSAEILKKGYIAVGITTKEKGKWRDEEKEKVDIQNKTLERVGKDVVKAVKLWINKLKKEKG